MTLSFSTKWPARMQSCAGEPNYFIEKIWYARPIFWDGKYMDYLEKHKVLFGDLWDGADVLPKLHTIRRGHRWKPGMKIHMVINNRKANRFQFAPVIECVSVQDIEIKHTGYAPNLPLVMVHNGKHLMNPLGYEEISELAINDGFDSPEHFFEYFSEDLQGQIVHWTHTRY